LGKDSRELTRKDIYISIPSKDDFNLLKKEMAQSMPER